MGTVDYRIEHSQQLLLASMCQLLTPRRPKYHLSLSGLSLTQETPRSIPVSHLPARAFEGWGRKGSKFVLASGVLNPEKGANERLSASVFR